MSGEGTADGAREAGPALEAGRRLFAGPCDFLRGVRTAPDLPPFALPEIAFAGRSNVGKSSLLNALTGRSTLARTSVTPGRTQEVNFFDLGGRLILADLPGYGFARAPKTEIARWSRLIDAYLKGRPTLRRVCLLIDARHGLKPPDLDKMRLLDVAAVAYLVVMTKADKVKPAELAGRCREVEQALARRPAAYPALIATSAVTGAGLPELRAHLADLAAPPAGETP